MLYKIVKGILKKKEKAEIKKQIFETYNVLFSI
jgi:hypothetical protein